MSELASEKDKDAGMVKPIFRGSSGAGAAVASGADFQSRLAAYWIALTLVDSDIPTFEHGRFVPSAVSFETGDALDDIRFVDAAGDLVYVQAKANISATLGIGGDLREVLDQCLVQYLRSWPEDGKNSKYLLAAGPGASRTISSTLKTALETSRHTSVQDFERDQPNAVVDLHKKCLSTLVDLQTNGDGDAKHETARAVLQRTYVASYDLSTGGTLEQAIILRLSAAGFSIPSGLWGQLIATSLDAAHRRGTLTIEAMFDLAKKFELPPAVKDTPEKRLEIIEMATNWPAARDVMLVEAELEGILPAPLVVFDLARFDEACEQRHRIDGDRVTTSGGVSGRVLLRAATLEGFARVTSELEKEIHGREVTFLAAEHDPDIESSPCAALHREHLRRALHGRVHPLTCLHCGRPIFEAGAHIVERGEGDAMEAGLIHAACRQPADRVMGGIRSELFEDNTDLVDFDLDGWLQSLPDGQFGFSGVPHMSTESIVLAWTPPEQQDLDGPFLVAFDLENGETRHASRRGRICRMTAAEADERVKQFKPLLASLTNDPFAFGAETWSSGRRSHLEPRIGASEDLLNIVGVRRVPYTCAIDNHESRRGNYYAPLLYLAERATGEPLSMIGVVPLLRDPSALGRFLKNWANAGWAPGNYVTESLLDDNSVDRIFARLFQAGLRPIIDPLLSVTETTALSAGIEVRPIPNLAIE